jgi:putative tryptophan/tyrosine transport system substrate-binding protein
MDPRRVESAGNTGVLVVYIGCLALVLGMLSAACVQPTIGSEPADRSVVVGFIATGAAQPWHDGLRHGLRSAGYVEGRNLTIEYRYAAGHPELLPGLVDELIGKRVAVIVAADTPSIREAMRRTTTIPIVMAVSGDPVGSGFVQSLARPGGNVTGLTTTAPELGGKRLEVLQQMLPGTRHVAVMTNPANPVNDTVLREIIDASSLFAIEVRPLAVRKVEELERTLDAAIADGIEAVIIVGDPLFAAQRTRIAELLGTYNLPSLVDSPLGDSGELLVFGPEFMDLFRRSGAYAGMILQGTSPADLPVERPTKFELIVNLKTAEALGIAVPSEVLLQADRLVR